MPPTRRTLRHAAAACVLATSTALAAPGPARAEAERIGTLDCYVAGGSGYVVGSSKDISCVFYDADGAPREHYVGELKKYGLDIGFTDEALMQWDVFIATGKTYQPGSLEGTFAGASASASLSFGLGATVLIGGLAEDFALQPVRIGTQDGVNIAIAITRMTLALVGSADPEPDAPEQPAQ
ncbi:MAG: DUF992 domain-containing protein [Nitratireductor sp.]|nr:DUF992 domain-containing protein [Nitratireductor sp.]